MIGSAPQAAQESEGEMKHYAERVSGGMVAATGRRFRRAGRRGGFVAVGLVSMLWLGSTASGAVRQLGILTTPRDEILPAANSYFAWSQNSAAHPHLYTEYVRGNLFSSVGPGPRIRVNHVGTQGFSGGIDATTITTLIYQQVKGHQSDIKLFNLMTHVRSDPTVGVNTPAWEYRPTISGPWILFGRLRASTHLTRAGYSPRRPART
jgi:hypothetical protein